MDEETRVIQGGWLRFTSEINYYEKAMFSDRATLAIQLFGAFEVTLDGVPINQFGTDKVRALLAYLAAESATPHRRDRLIGLFWPEQPEEQARQNLRRALTLLRQALSDQDDSTGFLRVDRETVTLVKEPGYYLDIDDFSAQVDVCSHHPHRRVTACLPCIKRLERALHLYRGGFLDQFSFADCNEFEEWLLVKREKFHRQVVDALDTLVTHHQSKGDLEAALDYAHRLAVLEPWREETHRQLMQLMAVSGRRSAAIAQYKTCKNVLQTELGIEPAPATQALLRAIQSGEISDGRMLSAGERTPFQVPEEHNSFAGREEELIALAELLANPQCRLISMIGPGGVGKSRLACQVARAHAGTFEHGIYFVPLEHVMKPDDIATVIAEVIGLEVHSANPEELLMNTLGARRKEMLLILDNLEQIEDAAIWIAGFMHKVPGIHLLITSRQRLFLDQEWVFNVEGLHYPETVFAMDTHEALLEQYSALALFESRARQVQHSFRIYPDNLNLIIQICKAVEGYPLAIELAAAWANAHSLEAVIDDFQHQIGMIRKEMPDIPERLRSLQSSFDISWQLLSPKELPGLSGLAVFQGGFSLEAAKKVADVEESLVIQLAEKSLIRCSENRQQTELRFNFHPVIQTLVIEKRDHTPAPSPDPYGASLEKHTSYYLNYLASQVPVLRGPGQSGAMNRIEGDLENIKAAWRQGLKTGQIELIHDSLEGLYLFYSTRSIFGEGLILFKDAVEQVERMIVENQPPESRIEQTLGRLMACQGSLHYRLRQLDEAGAILARAIKIAEAQEDHKWVAMPLLFYAILLWRWKDFQGAVAATQRSLAIFQDIGDLSGHARALYLYGWIANMQGEKDAAAQHLNASLNIARQAGDLRGKITPLNLLADVACHFSDFTKAITYYEEAKQISEQLQDRFNLAIITLNLGTIHHELGAFDLAEQSYLASRSMCAAIGDVQGEIIALANLGELACKQGRYRSANTLLQDGLALARSQKDEWSEVLLLTNLAESSIGARDFASAKRFLLLGLPLVMEQNSSELGSKILYQAAHWFIETGKHGSLAQELLCTINAHPGTTEALRKKAQSLLGDTEQQIEAQQVTLTIDEGLKLVYEKFQLEAEG